MKVELKNVKIAQFLSQETSAFTADVFVDGTKVGGVRNDGQGGSNIYYLGSFTRQLEEWAKGQKVDPLFPDVEMNLGMVFSMMVDEIEEEKRMRKFCSKGLLFRLDGDAKDSWRVVKLDKKVSAEVARAFVVEKYKSSVLEIANDRFSQGN